MREIEFRTVSENTWLFPSDTVGTPKREITLHAARGGNVLFQLLSDETIKGETPFSIAISGANGVTVTPYQLLPVHVEKNSAPRNKMGRTDNYEEVRDFVTARAPFDVFDITEEISDKLAEGRLALAFRLSLAKDAPVVCENITLTVTAGDAVFTVTLVLHIHKAVIPPLEHSKLIVCNWIYPSHIANSYDVEIYSDSYWRIFRNHLRHLLDMRSNHFSMMGGTSVIVGGVPIRDDSGKIIDFDFSIFEKHLQIADEMGFAALYGPYIARWDVWTEDNLHLLWDHDVLVTEREAYRQLSIFCRRLREMIERNGWQKKFIQPLVDEPQVNNERPYRILAAIYRRFMPGVPIHDPLETTDIGGAPDIFCVKQAVYEKYLPIYKEYQEMGERFTYYTCGYPAGDHMNRVLDLPLSVGRLSFWMCHRYGFEGFLHWGYHAFADRKQTFRTGPAGNQNIVYPAKDGEVAETVRSHAQRAGAEDWELFSILKQYDPAAAEDLILRGCRSFTDYERDGDTVDSIRIALLDELDKYI
ncbi:MAG: DUF4091 domain-containing protein [Ruminococcaceae bacterium]|nr:DUF4091 domain-containing protein [Oscillospiraceae bacterium]